MDPKTSLTFVCVAVAAGAWLLARFAIKVDEEEKAKAHRPAQTEDSFVAFMQRSPLHDADEIHLERDRSLQDGSGPRSHADDEPSNPTSPAQQ